MALIFHGSRQESFLDDLLGCQSHYKADPACELLRLETSYLFRIPSPTFALPSFLGLFFSTANFADLIFSSQKSFQRNLLIQCQITSSLRSSLEILESVA